MEAKILELKKFVEIVDRESSIFGSPHLDIGQCLRLKVTAGTASAILKALKVEVGGLVAENAKLRDELEKARGVYDNDVRLLRENLEGAQYAYRATHAQLKDEKARSIKRFNHQIGVMQNEFVVLRQQMQDEWEAERKVMQAKIDRLVTNTLEARRGEARAQKELSRIRGNLDEAGASRSPNETTDEEWAQLAQLGTRVSCDMVGWWLHRAFMLGKGAPLSECMMGPHGVICDDDADAIMITDLEGEMKPCAER